MNTPRIDFSTGNADAWRGFKPGLWQHHINVRWFIQQNYTPYAGDEAFLAPPNGGQSFEERVAAFAKMFVGRGEPAAAEIMANVFDADYLLAHDLVFIGSPSTVAAKIRAAAASGVFNTFMGEFNFSDLPEDALMRSIRLFGEKVIPALRGYEPF